MSMCGNFSIDIRPRPSSSSLVTLSLLLSSSDVLDVFVAVSRCGAYFIIRPHNVQSTRQPGTPPYHSCCPHIKPSLFFFFTGPTFFLPTSYVPLGGGCKLVNNT